MGLGWCGGGHAPSFASRGIYLVDTLLFIIMFFAVVVVDDPPSGRGYIRYFPARFLFFFQTLPEK